ncbi:unnamed protein product [Heterobilharzia americana]|nr:unnamed protein product [Heterobilharzia americana]
MSQSLLQTSSLVSVSSSSSSSQISGFIQCISQQFRVKSEYTVLIKITSNVDCFCQPVYHVLVNWPIVDHCDFSSTKDKCIEFLNKCRLRSWIRIFKLKKSRIYHKQNRENKVWVFIPDETFYESYYYNDTTMPSCYSPKCLSSHIGLIPSMNFHIIRVHTNGMFIELKCINYHLSQQYYLLFNNFQALQSTKMLMNTDYIKLSNIWCFNINYHAVDDECTKLYAILIPGIYSTVANNSHYSLKSIRSFGKPIQCYGECCNEGRQFDGNNFLLLLHDLHYLAYISMECQITGLHNEPMHFKVNTSGKQECTMPDLYQRVLSAIYKRVLSTKYTIYQYTEDFIQFPFIPSELQCNQFYCLMMKNYFNLVNIISILERVKILKRLNNESKQLYKFITSNQSVECIQCIRFGQMPTTTTTTPSSVKYTSTTNYSRFDYQHIWNVEIYNTRLLLKLGCEIVENSYLLIRISYSDPLPESFLIGQIVWCNTQGCFHFQSVQRNTLSIPCHVTADDNFISLPLIFDVMNGSDEIHPFVIPSNYSLVILKDVRLIYEEYPSSSIETMTSSNGSDICYAKSSSSSSSSSCSCSQMYIYAKEIIPLQINYTPEKVNLSRLFSSTTISSNDNFDPSIEFNPSQKLLWSYKFVGKPIDTTDNTISSSSSSITDTKLSNHQYTPNSHSELIHLSLIGDLAYRWYYTFRIGGQYHLTWYKYEQLIHVSTINQSNSFNEIYSSHSFINLYDILLNNQSSNCSMINSQFNFQVIILFKYYRIPYNDWILWVTDSISQSSNVIIKTECTYQLNNIYKIRLCNDEKSNNNMKLLLMNLSKVVLCKL